MRPAIYHHWICGLGLTAIMLPNARTWAQPSATGVPESLTPSTIVAAAYVAPDGTIQSDVAVVIADGKIREVLPAAQFQNKSGVFRTSGVLSPGLIDVRSSLGANGSARESAFSVDPGVSAISSIDLDHADFTRARGAGITAVVISPEPRNIVCGAGAVIKTSDAFGTPAVLRDDGPFCLALGPSVWEADREPTSRMGSIAILRQVLTDAAENRGHRRTQDFVAGKLDGIVHCGDAADVSAALRTLDRRSRFAIVYHGGEHDLVEEFAEAKVPVILGPFNMDTPQRWLTLPAALSSAGVSIVIAGGTPASPGEGLRLSASLAVRYGLDAAAARRAITQQAAEVAGASKQIGVIQPGADADLVVFSGDPLRLDSRVLEVYVNGIRVFDASLHAEGEGGHS